MRTLIFYFSKMASRQDVTIPQMASFLRVHTYLLRATQSILSSPVGSQAECVVPTQRLVPLTQNPDTAPFFAFGVRSPNPSGTIWTLCIICSHLHAYRDIRPTQSTKFCSFVPKTRETSSTKLNREAMAVCCQSGGKRQNSNQNVRLCTEFCVHCFLVRTSRSLENTRNELFSCHPA